MKTTKWFKTGESISSKATYLKTELKRGKLISRGDYYDPVDTYEWYEAHLYEIPMKGKSNEKNKLSSK